MCYFRRVPYAQSQGLESGNTPNHTQYLLEIFALSEVSIIEKIIPDIPGRIGLMIPPSVLQALYEVIDIKSIGNTHEPYNTKIETPFEVIKSPASLFNGPPP